MCGAIPLRMRTAYRHKHDQLKPKHIHVAWQRLYDLNWLSQVKSSTIYNTDMTSPTSHLNY